MLDLSSDPFTLLKEIRRMTLDMVHLKKDDRCANIFLISSRLDKIDQLIRKGFTNA